MDQEIYSNDYVKQLFDSIAPTYDKVNAITSLGFSKYWRKQFIHKIKIDTSSKVLDLMCGMGECWPYILKASSNSIDLTGVDLSSEMIKISEKKHRAIVNRSKIICGDVFETNFEASSFDVVISGFGLKTLSLDNIEQLASLVHRVLKPGGQFAFIEMSVPKQILIRWGFMLYLKRVIPFIGRLFLGNPHNYKMLGRYTEQFIGIEKVAETFKKAGLSVEITPLTMGCTMVLSGTKVT